ncbi:MAG: plastocyanin/azurin family copper-binding protein [Flavobacteriales bacterium]|nr:plastocyanin/azurin family copper-binding protein [Flavobacteriales bacterium]
MRNLLLLCITVFSFGFVQAQDCTGADHTVLAGNFYFNPQTLTITAGQSIAFFNEGGNHNVNGVTSSLGDSWTNPETFALAANSGAAGGVCMGTVTLNTPGSYNYDCSLGSHAANGMVGTIVVEEAAPTTVDVTFEVNMANETTSPDGVFLAGGLDFGVPGTNPMDDTDGDDIWTITKTLPYDYTGYYAFTNGNCPSWACKENLAGLPCGDPGNYNDRQLLNITENTTISTCFAECSTDGTCSKVAANSGCTDNTAANYDDTATTDNGSCEYNVTFSVDMSMYMGAYGTVNLNGPFNGWCGDCAAMTDVGNSVYELTTPLALGTFEYKFTLDGWTNQEEFAEGASCTSTIGGYTNRTLDVAGAEVLSVVCYNECDACGAVDPSLTVSVDVSCSGITDVTSARMTGPWWGWDPNGGPEATDNGDGTWSAVLDPAPGADMEYLWVVNGTQESLIQAMIDGGTCAPLTDYSSYANRQWAAGSESPADTFGQCDACDTGGPVSGCTDSEALNYNDAATEDNGSCQYNVTFSVDMSLYTGGYGTVNLNGTFNGWCGGCAAMADVGNSVYELTIPVTQDTIEYKFTLDGWTNQEEFAEGTSCTSTIEGYTNRSLVVAATEVLPTVCYNECDACAAPSGLTVSLDVSCSGITDITSARMTGPWWGWDPNGGPEATDNGDGTWSAVLDPVPTDNMEYLWVVNGAQESLIQAMIDGGACAPLTDYSSYANRQWEVGSANPADTYGQCDACDSGGPVSGCTDAEAANYNDAATEDDGTCQYDVTFSVDMSLYTGGYGTVNLNGTFNGWCGGCSELTDVGNSVYELTVPLALGTIEYKFTLDGWTNQEEFAEGAPCTTTIGGYTNRALDVAGAVALATVCYNQCGACDAAVGCTDTDAVNYDEDAATDDGSCVYNVTIRVDMSNQTVAAEGVHVAGAFQGWDPGATALTTPGLGIYEYSMQLSSGSYQFLYINGNTWDGQEVVPGECGADNGQGGFNRTLVLTGTVLEDVVCFNSCSACEGCTDPFSAEYDPFAGIDDGSCATPIVLGCTYEAADNYDPTANQDDGSCELSGTSSCPTDINGDGTNSVGDLLLLLGAFGQPCE